MTANAHSLQDPLANVAWCKSSHSHFEENACVEIGIGAHLVGIRDTKQAELPAATRPRLVIAPDAFAALLTSLG